VKLELARLGELAEAGAQRHELRSPHVGGLAHQRLAKFLFFKNRKMRILISKKKKNEVRRGPEEEWDAPDVVHAVLV
jgi:hypothetical protein